MDNTEISIRTVFRLTDIETGITVVAQNSRERTTNMRDALNRMAKLLVDHHYPSLPKDRAPHTDHVRTYNECTNRVVDISSGNKSSYKGYSLNEDIIKRKVSMNEA